MATTANRRSLNTESQLLSYASSCGICGGQLATGAGYSLGGLVVRYQYLSINAL